MKPSWTALIALPILLAGCGEDEAPAPRKAVVKAAVSQEEVDQWVEEALLDEDLPEPALSDDEIESLVDDLLEEETR